MQGYEADSLARALASMWPAWTPNLSKWSQMLADLDWNLANRTVKHLVRELDTPPSWAKFYKTYQELKPTAYVGPRCELCDGTGWVTDRNHPDHWPGHPAHTPPATDDGCACNVVAPCRCTVGQTTAADSFRKINTEREARRG